jgi:hypothetical protein
MPAIDAEFLASLRDAPASVRVHAWIRMIQAIQSEQASESEQAQPSEATFTELDRILVSWPARSRPAWGDWYADVETTESNSQWEHETRSDIFQRLRQPTEPAFRLARHVGMWFDEGVGAEQIAAFARWPSLRTITSVSLDTRYQPELSDAIAEFARSGQTQHLREYTLGLGGVTPAGLEEIFEALPVCLERLWIYDVRIEPASFVQLLMDALAMWPRRVGLAVHRCDLGPEGVHTLAECGAFDRLTELTLHGVRLDDAAAARWAMNRPPGGLRKLDLEEQYFDGKHAMQGPGLLALVEAGWLDKLESLSLSYHQLSGDTLTQVLERADLRELRHLRLHCTGFDASDAAQLRAARPHLPALEHVEISYTQLDDAAAHALAEEFKSARVRRWIG